jgi:hypothetical protein
VKPTDYAALRSGLVRRLEDVYAVCVTAETALAAQNADHDAEIARALRAGVSEVVAADIEPAVQLIKTCADRAAIRDGRGTSARSQRANAPASATRSSDPSRCDGV